MIEALKKNCVTGDFKLTLESLIGNCKKSRIKSIAAAHGIKLSDKLTKQQMLEETVPAVEANAGLKIKKYSDDDIQMVFDNLCKEEIDEQEAEGIINAAPFKDGVMYIGLKDNKFIPCISHEVAGKFMEHCAGRFFRADDDPMASGAKVCAAIYGKFTPELLSKIVNLAYDMDCSTKQAEEYLSSTDGFTYDNGAATAAGTKSFKIATAAENLDYDIPTRSEIKAYAAYGINSTDFYYRQIVNFLYSKSGITYNKCAVLLKEISLWCITDGELPEIFEYIRLSEPKIRAEQFNFLLDMIGELHYRTRKWSLKGHKPCDVKGVPHIGMPHVVSKQEEKTAHIETVHIAPKIGRNDPCPCGSGKKYKKCCGKSK